MSKPSDKRDAPTLFGDAGPYLLLGWQIALGFIAFAGIGYGLDVWLGTLPWFLLAGIGFGVVSIFLQIYRLTTELQTHDRHRRNRTGPPKYKTWQEEPDTWTHDDWKQDDRDNNTSDERRTTNND